MLAMGRALMGKPRLLMLDERRRTDHGLLAPLSPTALRAALIRLVTVDSETPHACNQIVLGDDPVPVPDQENQQIQHLRLELHEVVLAPQLAPAGIQREIIEMKEHAFPSGTVRQRIIKAVSRANQAAVKALCGRYWHHG